MKENDIRPQDLFDELLRLNRLDIEKYFTDVESAPIVCPACGWRGEHTFRKNGFDFDECRRCKTLYVSPRPKKEYFDAYYTDSESTKFWATTFYKSTEKNRREQLWKPKARLVREKIEQFAPESEEIVDIGGGYGIFIEEFSKISAIGHRIIEPSEYLSDVCKEKGLNVIVDFLENLETGDFSKQKRVFVSFELFEHLHDPKKFLTTLYELMSDEDVFIFTTLSGMGVDIRTLWDAAKPVSPPMHLNFLNPKSIALLLGSVGLELLEVTTPGKLDLDIMNNNKGQLRDRFWKDFLEYASEEEKDLMQKHLSANLLSSHMMVVCRKV
jgi:2-polyprenyl-3-methyl-5-hydroxy-6-metoxy-1,4-benzoquinol methylase